MTTPLSRQTWLSYLRWMFATTVVVVAVVSTFNIFIDPLNAFGSPRVAGLNVIKPHLDHHRNITIYKSALRSCPNAGIFGNSRSEVGFDPLNPAFAEHGLSIFNHGIGGTRATTAYLQLMWLKAHNCMPKTIFLGVEFFDFLGGLALGPLPTLETNPPPRLDKQFFGESVFSVTALRDSFTTIFAQHSRYPATTTDLGYNPMLNYIPEVSRSGHYVLFRQRAQEYVRQWARTPRRIRAEDGGLSNDEATVDAIISNAARAGLTTYVIIYPYHAEIRLILERLGLGGLFAEWRRLIVANAERSAKLGGKVEVWDFSGIGPETLESIPAKGDHQTRMAWYWEPGHFKKELGSLLIDRVLGKPGSFGMKLDSKNLDAWLAEDRRRVQAVLAHPSPLVSEVEDLINQAQLSN